MPFHVIDKVVVEDDGDGDPVVCVHGLGGSANTWTAVMDAMKGHRVLRVELPGSARSLAPSGTLGIEFMAAALEGVCNHLKIQRAQWVGHSLGTIVCQHVAARQPRLVRSMALFGPLLAPGDPARKAIRARADAVEAGGAGAMRDVAQALMLGATSAHSRERNPVVAAFVRESLSRQDPMAYARTCRALADAHSADLTRVAAPSLLITGDEDAVAPPQAVRAMADALAQHHARPQVTVLPRCGHWTPIERPEDCARELRAWLARLP